MSTKKIVRQFRNGRNEEGRTQIRVIRWWDDGIHSRFNLPKEALFHVPNGGGRDKASASILKLMGVRRGIPDLFIDVPRGQYHGLRIELKQDETRTVTTEQRQRIKELNERGYYACICYGYEECINAITIYLSL